MIFNKNSISLPYKEENENFILLSKELHAIILFSG